MKKWIAMVLSTALMLCLVSCGGSGDASSGEKPPVGQETPAGNRDADIAGKLTGKLIEIGSFAAVEISYDHTNNIMTAVTSTRGGTETGTGSFDTDGQGRIVYEEVGGYTTSVNEYGMGSTRFTQTDIKLCELYTEYYESGSISCRRGSDYEYRFNEAGVRTYSKINNDIFWESGDYGGTVTVETTYEYEFSEYNANGMPAEGSGMAFEGGVDSDERYGVDELEVSIKYDADGRVTEVVETGNYEVTTTTYRYYDDGKLKEKALLVVDPYGEVLSDVSESYFYGGMSIEGTQMMLGGLVDLSIWDIAESMEVRADHDIDVVDINITEQRYSDDGRMAMVSAHLKYLYAGGAKDHELDCVILLEYYSVDGWTVLEAYAEDGQFWIQ